ncbi:15623_t:CDS:2, partial [Dentiscutata erythropus]
MGMKNTRDVISHTFMLYASFTLSSPASEREGALSSPTVPVVHTDFCYSLVDEPSRDGVERPQDDSPFEEAFSVPESVAVQLKKHMPFGENVEPEALPEVAVTASPSLCEEDRKTNEFLDLVQKRSVSDGIRHRKRKEKLQHETAENPKDQEAPMISQNISSVKNVPILDDQQKITYLEE